MENNGIKMINFNGLGETQVSLQNKEDTIETTQQAPVLIFSSLIISKPFFFKQM